MKIYVDFLRQYESQAPSERDGFTQWFWPQAEDYDSSLPRLFVGRVQRIEQLNIARAWLVRDGILPFYQFQKRFVRPRGLKTELLIHESLAPWVTPAWRSSCRAYRYISGLRGTRSQAADRVIIAGLAFSKMVDWNNLDQRLKKFVNKRGKPREAIAVMPVRNIGGLDESDFTYRLAEKISSHFGSIKYVAWHDADKIPAIDRSVLIELNHRDILADGYMSHYFMARGAILPGARGKVDLPLSLHHGLAIHSLTARPLTDEQKRRIFNFREKINNWDWMGLYDWK